MADITRLDSRSKPREATCTGAVPSNLAPRAELEQVLIQLDHIEALVKSVRHAVLAALDGQGGAA